eukprot:scaffold17436_cov24-Phaeocystis_antarctica.AAC.1
MYWSQTESSKCSLDRLSFHPRHPFTGVAVTLASYDATRRIEALRRASAGALAWSLLWRRARSQKVGRVGWKNARWRAEFCPTGYEQCT